MEVDYSANDAAEALARTDADANCLLDTDVNLPMQGEDLEITPAPQRGRRPPLPVTGVQEGSQSPRHGSPRRGRHEEPRQKRSGTARAFGITVSEIFGNLGKPALLRFA